MCSVTKDDICCKAQEDTMRTRSLLAAGTERTLAFHLALKCSAGPKQGSAQRRWGITTPTPGSHCSTILEAKLESQVPPGSHFPDLRLVRAYLVSASSLSPSSSSWPTTPHPVSTGSHQHPLTAIRKLGELTEDSESQEMQEQQCRPGLGVVKVLQSAPSPQGPMCHQASLWPGQSIYSSAVKPGQQQRLDTAAWRS